MEFYGKVREFVNSNGIYLLKMKYSMKRIATIITLDIFPNSSAPKPKESVP